MRQIAKLSAPMLLILLMTLNCFADGLTCTESFGGNTITDDSGVAGICYEGHYGGNNNDSFITQNERLTIRRSMPRPNSPIFALSYEYCWYREPSGKCRSCFFNDCKEQWSYPKAAYFSPALAGETRSVGSRNVCIVRTGSSENFKHGGTNDGDFDKYCAYVVTRPSNSSGCDPITTDCTQTTDECEDPIFNWTYSLIGCVDQYIMPLPQTYNQTIESYPIPEVYKADLTGDTGYLKLGSTFDEPMIKLQVKTEAGVVLGDVSLYKTYIQNNNKPNCGKISMKDPTYKESLYDIEYCANVPDDKPNKICACVSNNCASKEYIGCVDRPTPQQSGFIPFGQFKWFEDAQGISYPGIFVYFVKKDPTSGLKIIKDEDGDYVDLQSDGNFYKYQKDSTTLSSTLASGEVIMDKLALPDSSYKPAVDYVKMSDTSGVKYELYSPLPEEVYGVKISAVIPKLSSSGDMQMMNYKENCHSIVSSNDIKDPALVKVTGTRMRDGCCPAKDAKKIDGECIEKLWDYCDSDGYISVTDDLSAAYCPGAYVSQTNPSDQDMICAISGSDWPIIQPSDKVCVPIPNGCGTYDKPTPMNGYAIWDDPLDTSGKQSGKCDSSFGYEEANDLTYTVSSTVKSADLQKLLDMYKADGVSFPESILKDFGASGYSYKSEPPSRSITKDGVCKIESKCSPVPGCVSIASASEATGFATWANTNNSLSSIDLDLAKNLINNPKYIVLENNNTSSSCMSGYSGSSSRVCKTIIKTDDSGSKAIIHQYWMPPSSSCQKQVR